jgi:hypothetical protein
VTTPQTDWRTQRVVAKLKRLERERREWYMAESERRDRAESVTDRPTRAHDYILLVTKQDRYFYDAGAIKESQSKSTWQRCQVTVGLAL